MAIIPEKIESCVLVVTEDATTHCSRKQTLLDKTWTVEFVPAGSTVMERLQCEPIPEIIFVELNSENKVIEFIECLQKIRPEMNLSAISTDHDARYLADTLKIRTKFCLRSRFRNLEQAPGNLIGKEPAMPFVQNLPTTQLSDGRLWITAGEVTQRLWSEANMLAHGDAPVVISGESGVGKESLARLIHQLSSRADYPFTKINCSMSPYHLEATLFGYRDDSAMSAIAPPEGAIERSHKGTIMLEEVAEMPLSLQAKLLECLQRKELQLGYKGERTAAIDVRLLATTSFNPRQANRRKWLHDGFYDSLCALTVHVPPLRQRRDEIGTMLQFKVWSYCKTLGKPVVPLSFGLLKACSGYSWPGNMRELENFSKRLLLLGNTDVAPEVHKRDNVIPICGGLKSNEADGDVRTDEGIREVQSEGGQSGLKPLLNRLRTDAEIAAIRKALDETNWNRKRAAKILAISYRGLLYKIQRYGIDRAASH